MADGQAAGPPGAPDGQAFRIVSRLREMTSASHRLERRLAEQFELNHTDLAAMDHLSRVGSATPRELAAELGVTSAATTFVVDRLAAMGHVHRSPHPDDRRKTVVTPDADSIMNIAVRMAPLGDPILAYLDALPQEERDAIEGFLTRVTEVLREQIGG